VNTEDLSSSGFASATVASLSQLDEGDPGPPTEMFPGLTDDDLSPPNDFYGVGFTDIPPDDMNKIATDDLLESMLVSSDNCYFVTVISSLTRSAERHGAEEYIRSPGAWRGGIHTNELVPGASTV
jgi:hypothetical protein